MTNWKYGIKGKIRNIQLISDTDPEYTSYVEEARLNKLHLRPKAQRTYSDLASVPLEIAVREWVKFTGKALDNRILSYEVLSSQNKYERRFNELDFIHYADKKYILGEVKVSSLEKMKKKASNQLLNAFAILEQKEKDCNIELLVVYINLNFKNSETPCTPFHHDFSKMDLITSENNQSRCSYLILDPVEIFNWGVEKGIIRSADLLQKAIEEADNNHLRRRKRQELRDANIPEDEWSEELKCVGREPNNETHVISFGNTTSPNLLAERLKAALEKKKLKEKDHVNDTSSNK